MLSFGSRFATLRMVSVAVAFVAVGGASACSSTPESTTPAGGSPSASTPGESPGTSEGVAATDALYFYPPVEGATSKFATTGIAAGSTDVTVRSVTSAADGETVTVDEVNTGSDTPVTIERTFRTGPDGGLNIDAAGFAASAPGMTVTATGDDIVIPPISQLESGASSTGETYVELSGSGLTARNDVTYTVTGGGFNSVTVPAGTVEAYLVKLELDLVSTFVGSAKGTATYWIRPGFGLVRQEMVIAGMTITTELVSTSVPLT